MKNVKEMVLRRLENQVEEENVVEEAKEQIGEGEFLQMVLQEINNKTFNLVGAFDEEQLKRFKEFASNLYFYENDPNPTVNIRISSYGGNIDILFAILSEIERLKEMWECSVTTSVAGWASSCGALLWLCGNKREMSEFDEIMLHQISYGINQNLTGHERELKRSQKIQKKIDKLITTHSPLTQKQLNKFYKNGDTFLDYEDCLKLDLITIEEKDGENEGEETK